MVLPSMFGIQPQSQCLLLNVDIDCKVSIECLALDSIPNLEFNAWRHSQVYVIFSPNVVIQCQAWDSIPNLVFKTMIIRLVFNASFGIESQSFNVKEVCMTAFTSICGIHPQI